jgi:hypothetical protein
MHHSCQLSHDALRSLDRCLGSSSARCIADAGNGAAFELICWFFPAESLGGDASIFANMTEIASPTQCARSCNVHAQQDKVMASHRML